MSTSFMSELVNVHNKTVTANGDAAFQSSLDANLDLFALAGAMRDRKHEAVKLFRRAYGENPLLAVRCMFYLRDVRGGQGERELFRAMMQELFTIDKKVGKKVLKHISEFGRWDDLLNCGAKIDDVVGIVAEQLDKDLVEMRANKTVSLLAKWLPSENASSSASKDMAQKLAKTLGFSPREYRKTVVSLRRHIQLLEQKMSAKLWGDVVYDKLPSVAFKKHTKAFKRNDEARYTEFLGQVNAGEKKVNAGALYTYEIYDLGRLKGDWTSADALWKNLPDYTNGKPAIVVADVSGSMMGKPMSVSVSLALYFAERNKGPFHGYFLTFSENSRLVKVVGNSLYEKVHNIESADWGGSTNIMSAFKAILTAAVNAKASQDEIPAVLYIVSDMQFNACTNGADTSSFERAKKMFEDAGYVLPHVVFWNVNAFNTQTPVTKDEKNVTLVSGLSQSTFKHAVQGKTPLESMTDVLNSERYLQITV
jgi:hypothetical protein